MTQPTEQPQYWQYQVRASMAGQKPLNELLLSEKRTQAQAVEYCTERWGNRFKADSLKPYDPIKVSKAKDARTDVLTPAERMQRHREGLERKRRLAEKQNPRPKEDKRLWIVTLANGEQKEMKSFKRTFEAVTKAAKSRYGQQVKNIDEWPQLPK